MKGRAFARLHAPNTGVLMERESQVRIGTLHRAHGFAEPETPQNLGHN
jgi:hypothetical protein